MRIEGPTVDEDLFGAGKDGFTRGNPLTSDPATVVTEHWLNAVQEYLVREFEARGITPPTVLLPDHDLLVRSLNIRQFLAASANWKPVSGYSPAGECLGAGFARVPNLGGTGPDRDQWILVGDATFDVDIFADGDLRARSTLATTDITQDVIHAFGPSTPGRWIRVANGGKIYSTAEAFATTGNWTARTSGTAEHLIGLGLRGSSEVLAVGNLGTWCHSTDGVTWTTGTTGAAHAYRAVAWHDGEWWAVGTASGGTNGIVSRSSDHVSWSHTDLGAGNFINDIVADGTTVHMVSDNGKIYSMFDPAKIAWSINTIWTARNLRSIDFDGAGYVVAADGPWIFTAPETDRGVPSPWTLRSTSISVLDQNVVRAGAGRWVAGGASGDILTISDARY